MSIVTSKEKKRDTKPFEYSFMPQFAAILHQLGISLAISTYQAGKVVIISAPEENRLIQLPRTFENAMGIAVGKNKLAVSTHNEVIVLQNHPELAASYPNKKGVYDGIYIPRARYNTGYLDLHDMAFIKNKLTAVNTLFSCLSHIDGEYSFKPFWQPPFISEIRPEDHCHLNGMAIGNNEIKYLTALGNTNTVQGWRDNKMNGGILMEYPSGRIILDGLAIPHSPRMYDGKLYVLNSAKGELLCVDPEKGTSELIVNTGGYARGMARHGDYLFIGVSKLRHKNKIFSDLDIAKTSFAGIIAVNLPDKSIAGHFKYEMSVDEIYDVKIIEGSLRPSILSTEMPVHGLAITTPMGSYWSNPDAEEIPINHNNNGHDAIIKSEKPEIRYRMYEEISFGDLTKQFNGLIHPLCVKKFHNQPINPNLLSVLAFENEKPVALTVTELKNDNTAELHSVMVKKDYQNKGIASQMLRSNDQLLKNKNIQHIDVSWFDAIKHAKEFGLLLKSSDWLEPQTRSLNIKLNVNALVKASWVNHALNSKEKNSEIIDWADINSEDIKNLASIKKQEGFPAYLTPFQLPDVLDSKVSKILRVNDEAVGWIIFHKTKPGALQCSSFYVLKEHRSKNRSLRLIAKSAVDCHKLNILQCNYQTIYEDRAVTRFLYKLFSASDAILKQFHTLASRKYYNDLNTIKN